MEWNRRRWHFVKEDNPLRYSVLLNDFFEEVHGYCLNHLEHYTKWIKPRGWCYKVILQREQLNYCKHLTWEEPPPDDVERPSESTLHSHQAAYEAAKRNGKSPQKGKSHSPGDPYSPWIRGGVLLHHRRGAGSSTQGS